MNQFIKAALILVAIVLLTSMAYSQKSGVLTTAHNVNNAGCQSCHAPHNGSALIGGTDQATGKILLWDRAFSTQTFGTYDSPTLNSKASEIGGGTPLVSTEARMYSMLCMSCHDGVTTTSVIQATNSAAVGNPTNSAGLQNDHPVNMNYDPVADTGLAAIASVTTAGLKLYGANNTVQCASCHNVHNNTNDPFLRISNTSSALCTTCHT